MCFISVVIPAYNAGDTIREAILSVLSQTYKNFEIVVCDDASFDNTSSIINSLNDSRIKLIKNQVNMGEGYTRDRAIESASGEWIALLDADDTWHSRRLEIFVKYVQSNHDLVVFDNFMICHDVQNKLVPWQRLRGYFSFGYFINSPREISFSDYIKSRRLICQSMFPKSIITKNRIHHSTKKFAADTEFLLDILASGAKLFYIPLPMYNYRVTPGSMTGKSTDHSLMRKCLIECLKKHNWSENNKKALIKKIKMLRQDETLYAMRAAAKNKNWRLVWKEFWSYPQAIVALPYRLSTVITYEWHRIKNGGSLR